MKIDFYTTDWCGDCVRSKALLKKFDLDFNEINVDLDENANEYIKTLQILSLIHISEPTRPY